MTIKITIKSMFTKGQISPKQLCRIYKSYKEKNKLEINNKMSMKYYRFKNIKEKIHRLKNELKVNIWLNFENSVIDNTYDLGSVYAISLTNCSSIKKCDNLELVDTIKIYRCLNLKDVCGLQHVNTLDLHYCHNIIDLTMLHSVNTLNIINCDKIKDVGNLRNLKILKINKKIDGLYLLKNLEELEVSESIADKMKNQIVKLKKINKNVKIKYVFENNYT
jgi:hypothetical protein